MFKLRVKRNFASDWIEFITVKDFYEFIDNQYEESIEEKWQWYDNEIQEWRNFSQDFVKGNKIKLWFI